jgi:putative ABC transport system permease protein
MIPLDLRHALRGLVRRPAFTAAAILTLALGIGANTAIFSAVWHLLLAPLPFPDGDRMGYLWDTVESGFSVVPSSRQADAFMEASRTLDWIEPHSSVTMAWRGEATTDVVEAGLVTHTLPARLGVSPVLGRTFAESETAAAGAAVVMVSETFWRTRLGGAPDVTGSTLRLDGRVYEVIGVMPDRFSRFRQHGTARAVWLPLVRSDGDRLNLVAVHRTGATPEEVGEELTAISANIAESQMGATQPVTKLTMPGQGLGQNTRTALFVLLAAVGVVLLIACANVAGLLIVRSGDRRRELAICVALGANRLAIFRYLFLETVLIALAGGTAGLLLGAWGIELVRSIRPPYLPELDGISLDPVVLAFAGCITILTIGLFGIVPSLLAARTNLREQFSASTGGSTGSPEGGRTGGALVVAEVALAVVLLVGASLLVRTMVRLSDEPLGFDAAGTLTFSIDLPQDRYADQASWSTFGARLDDELEGLPGVEVASLSTGVPPSLGILFGQLSVQGRAEPFDDRIMNSAAVSPDYFRTLGIDLLEGRAFEGTPADDHSIIVNRATADRLWPGETAIGRRMRVSSSDASPWRTVIGVTPDLAVHGPATDRTEQPLVFLPLDFSYGFSTATIRVRSGDPLELVSAVRAAVARLDPDVPVRAAATMEQLLAESVGRQRFNMILFTTFAGLALVLSTVGLYGIVAYNVSRRSRELGIRSALGATPQNVRGMVIRQGAILAGSGAILGGLAALQLTGFMTDLLHGVPPTDPLSFAGAVVAVMVVSMFATWVPARRASRVDPVVALRQQ